MTERTIYIKKTRQSFVSFLTNEEALKLNGKGWGYSFVYSLKELRDIFLTLKKHGFQNLKSFSCKYVINKIPYAQSPWTERRVLETLNALINFELIDKDYNIISEMNFSNSEIGDDLSTDDKKIFENIFFTYFRFKEFASLYIQPKELYTGNLTKAILIDNAQPLYSFISETKYVDSFFSVLEKEPQIYIIPNLNVVGNKNGGVKRFWDVFTSWGLQLEILEKFNISSLGYKTENSKSISCSYFLREKKMTVHLLDFIKENFNNKTRIDLSELIFKLCITFRISIKEAQEYVLNEYSDSQEQMSMTRTSEIFVKKSEIKKNDKILYPQYKDSYVSHIILRS